MNQNSIETLIAGLTMKEKIPTNFKVVYQKLPKMKHKGKLE
jgi:hypothetical protein